MRSCGKYDFKDGRKSIQIKVAVAEGLMYMYYRENNSSRLLSEVFSSEILESLVYLVLILVGEL